MNAFRCKCPQCGNFETLSTLPANALICKKCLMDMIIERVELRIDSDVKLPRSKLALSKEERAKLVFKAYAEAYQEAHVRRVKLAHWDNKHVTIDYGSYPYQRTFTIKRLKELTAMLRNRAMDR